MQPCQFDELPGITAVHGPTGLCRVDAEAEGCSIAFFVQNIADGQRLSVDHAFLYRRLLPPALRKVRMSVKRRSNPEGPCVLAPGARCEVLLQLHGPMSKNTVGQHAVVVAFACRQQGGGAKDAAVNLPLLLARARVHIVSDVAAGLNSEAPVFIPTWMRQRFDFPVPLLAFPEEAFPLTAQRNMRTSFARVEALLQEGAASSTEPPPVERYGETQWPEYREHWRHLLRLEHAAGLTETQAYDLVGVTPSPHSLSYMSLSVPGAPDKRPLLRLGDVVRMRPCSKNTVQFELQCRIVVIRGSRMTVALPPGATYSSHVLPFQPWHVRFQAPHVEGLAAILNTMAVMPKPAYLRVVLCTNAIPAACAPSMATTATPATVRNMPSLNESQRTAVAWALTECSRPLVVFGPPGTGKTLVAASMVQRILQHMPAARVLLTAPSEAAVDMLVDRLHALLPGAARMLALFSPKRQCSSIARATVLKHVCWRGNTDVFAIPCRRRMKEYSVVVCTCVFAERLRHIGLHRTHFSHILIDEAGQATEPEALVPLWFANMATKIVLLGDPFQLGPRLRSAAAAASGLSVSLLQRWIAQARTLPRAAAPRVVRLTHNYRSHASIFAVPSKLFYDEALVPSAVPAVVRSLLSWKRLQRARGAAAATSVDAAAHTARLTPFATPAAAPGGSSEAAVMMLGIVGQDEHAPGSPSFANRDEAVHVLQVIRSLLRSGLPVRVHDMAVIAAYRQQVVFLRHLLREHDLGGVLVGLAPDFQGSESKVVIVSTVLSSNFGPAVAHALQRHRDWFHTPGGGAGHAAECDAALLPQPQWLATKQEAASWSHDGAAPGVDSALSLADGHGLLGAPRHMNVALTRAKALTVVVGNPHILALDPWWVHYLQQCAALGTVVGTSVPLVPHPAPVAKCVSPEQAMSLSHAVA